jgi:hypothetical protein
LDDKLVMRNALSLHHLMEAEKQRARMYFTIGIGRRQQMKDGNGESRCVACAQRLHSASQTHHGKAAVAPENNTPGAVVSGRPGEA